MKTQIHIRASEATRAKLEALAERYGTKTEAVAVAIDRLYQAEMRGEKKMDDNMVALELNTRDLEIAMLAIYYAANHVQQPGDAEVLMGLVAWMNDQAIAKTGKNLLTRAGLWPQ